MRVIDQEELGFSVALRHRREGTLVVVEGELDVVTAPYLSDSLGRMVAEDAQRTVHLDLSGVGFIDCAGWRPVAEAASALEGDGGRLIVVGASHPVRRFMQVLADHRIEVRPDGRDGSES